MASGSSTVLDRLINSRHRCRNRDLQRQTGSGLDVVQNYNGVNDDHIRFGKRGELASNRGEEQELSGRGPPSLFHSNLTPLRIMRRRPDQRLDLSAPPQPAHATQEKTMIVMTRGDSPDANTRARRPPLAARLAVMIASCAVLMAGCSTTSGLPGPSTAAAGDQLPVGSSTHTITVDGTARTFLVHRPPSLSGPAPLVVMIHGGGGTAAGAERSYGWDAEADSQHFVVAYPDGLGRGWSVGGGCCHGLGSSNPGPDVAFITEVVNTISQATPIDPQRIYATGISEGGMMSYRLACQSTTFAAIGPDSATLLGSCPSPAPISIIHIHGTADARIPYDGSPGSGVHHIQGPAVPALNATWRSIDHCATPTDTTGGALTTSTASCPAGRGVELIAISGAGHQWPGSTCNRRCVAGTADPPSTALNATPTIWRFFIDHPKPGAIP